MIIGFTGQKQSGKNTAAQALTGYHQAAFADALRYVLKEALYVEVTEENKEQAGRWLDRLISFLVWQKGGVNPQLEWGGLVRLLLGRCANAYWSYVDGYQHALLLPNDMLDSFQGKAKAYELLNANAFGPEIFTPRRILQVVGTDIFRAWNTDCWVKALDAKIKHLENVVISDVRFPNEVDYIHRRGGIVIRITRPDTDKPAPEHASEDVSTLEADYEIVNDSGKTHLGYAVCAILQRFGDIGCRKETEGEA